MTRGYGLCVDGMEEAAVDTAALWQELLVCAAAEDDASQQRATAIVSALNRQGSPEVVDWALPLLSDEQGWKRDLAAWVLGQHGFPQGWPFGAPAVAAAARRELDGDVRAAMVVSLGHAEDPKWADELMRYAIDPEPSIRQAVASSLPLMFRGEDMSQLAVDVLLALMTDVDAMCGTGPPSRWVLRASSTRHRSAMPSLPGSRTMTLRMTSRLLVRPCSVWPHGATRASRRTCGAGLTVTSSASGT